MPTTRSQTARSITSRSVECLCVAPDLAGKMWPHVSGFIREAMRRGGMGDFGTVESGVLEGGSLLWIAWDGAEILAAAVTELANFDDLKICTIVACGGHDWDRFGHLIGDLENYARAEHCKSVRIIGRRGWERLLPDYSATRIVLEKEL